MKALSIICAALLTWFLIYFFLPTFSYGFYGWSFIIMIISILLFAMNIKEDIDDNQKNPLLLVSIVLFAISLLFLAIIPMFTSWSLFHADSYQKQIGKVEEKSISTDISPTSIENIVVIDDQTAHRLGTKKLVDEDHALGSQVEVDHFTLQKVGDKLYYIAPLLHTGFFKWNQNKGGTPGYIMVNATNEKDVKLVKEDLNKNPIHLKYQMGSCFGDYLPRHLYFNGYMTTGLTDFSFEVDDNLKPWYVVTTYAPTIGYGGDEATGVLLVDPTSGKIEAYSINDTPAWVDRVQPVEFVDDQLNNWGYYVHGWLNPSDQDRIQLSQGNTLVYGEDGRCYFYSGVSSVGRDGASIGFFLVDSRTKAAHFYKAGGAVENAAQSSAEGAVAEKHYQATHPRPYNINGTFTYVMALKDQEGLIKDVALVSYDNYQIVGVGADIRDALRNYKSKLNSNGNSIAPESGVVFQKVEDQILRISSDVKQGQTYYYIQLKHVNNKIFVATSSVSEKLPLSRDFDPVTIYYSNENDGIVDIQQFDNQYVHFNKSESQEKVDSYFKEVDSVQTATKVEKNANTLYEQLTPEEKTKLIKEIKNKKQ